MTISNFDEEPPADEDGGPGVRGRRHHDPAEPVPELPPAGVEAHDLPIARVEEEEERGGEEEEDRRARLSESLF